MKKKLTKPVAALIEPERSAIWDENFRRLHAALTELDGKSSPMVYRLIKDAPLTWEEVDRNFLMLERRLIALEKGRRLTPEERAKFFRLSAATADRDKVKRLTARLKLNKFVIEHGEDACQAAWDAARAARKIKL